jgi:hypothetical protein
MAEICTPRATHTPPIRADCPTARPQRRSASAAARKSSLTLNYSDDATNGRTPIGRKSADFAEEHIASIFKLEEWAKEETSANADGKQKQN